MNKTMLTLIILCVLQLRSQSQNTIDALVLKIPQPNSTADIISYVKQNFTADTARIRAIYVWVANNISYDVERLKAIDKNENPPPQPVDDVLKKRSAVCQGYADLFAELCNGVGIKTIVVPGYTKRNGVIAPIGHAWAALELNGTWYLFDPTWGAGYVRNDQFVKNFNNTFYKVPPYELIKDHMPFDPMYQFANYPITNKEFIEGKISDNPPKSFFNYADSIKQFSQLSTQDKTLAELRRIEANGVRIDLIQKRVNYLKLNMQSYTSKDSFLEGVDNMKRANALFQEYFNHKNKRFADVEDNDLRRLVDSISIYVKAARKLLNSATPRTDAQREMMANNNHNLETFQTRFLQEKDFTEKYLAADKNLRMQLFMRR